MSHGSEVLHSASAERSSCGTWNRLSPDLVTNPGAATWSFDAEDLAALTRTVDRFLADTGARSALIADRAGQLVATMGQPLTFDPTVFATLTAADFSANDQLARLIGETDFTTLFHQGEKESMYVADVARRLILVTLFDNRTPIGLVRLKMKPVVEELTAHLDRAFVRARESGTTQPNILAGASDEIDELFNW